MSIIQTNDGSQYQKPTVLTTVGAIAAGSTVQQLASGVSSAASTPLINKMRNLNNPKDTVEISNALKTALEKSGLKDKVELMEFTSKNNYKDLGEFCKGIFKKIKSGKSSIGTEIIELQKNMIKEGFNAGFSPQINSVMINTEKMGLTGFHEIGHSINFNNSKFWKAMQITRFASLPMVGLLSMIALCKRKKAEGEEPKGIIDKTTTFIKNNVGKLSFAAMVPMIAEEIKASQRGNKLAKELLKPELYEKVVKSNKYGALSYIATAALVSIGA